MRGGSITRSHGPRQNRRRVVGGRFLAAALLAAIVMGLAACGDNPGASEPPAPSEITVFAAASLTDAFTKMGEAFSATHSGVTVTFNFAGSNDLVTQMQQGARADVFASADTSNMEKAGELVNEPTVFAANKLAIAVAPGNPQSIAGLSDLSRPDLKVVLAAPEVPAGKYAADVFDRAGVDVSPVSLEVSVKGVVTKVALGEADAGIVYVTDVTAADDDIDTVEIPDADNVVATYPIATVVGSDLGADAQAFVDFVLSDEGQRLLASYGFLAPPLE